MKKVNYELYVLNDNQGRKTMQPRNHIISSFWQSFEQVNLAREQITQDQQAWILSLKKVLNFQTEWGPHHKKFLQPKTSYHQLMLAQDHHAITEIKFDHVIAYAHAPGCKGSNHLYGQVELIQRELEQDIEAFRRDKNARRPYVDGLFAYDDRAYTSASIWKYLLVNKKLTPDELYQLALSCNTRELKIKALKIINRLIKTFDRAEDEEALIKISDQLKEYRKNISASTISDLQEQNTLLTAQSSVRNAADLALFSRHLQEINVALENKEKNKKKKKRVDLYTPLEYIRKKLTTDVNAFKENDAAGLDYVDALFACHELTASVAIWKQLLVKNVLTPQVLYRLAMSRNSRELKDKALNIINKLINRLGRYKDRLEIRDQLNELKNKVYESAEKENESNQQVSTGAGTAASTLNDPQEKNALLTTDTSPQEDFSVKLNRVLNVEKKYDTTEDKAFANAVAAAVIVRCHPQILQDIQSFKEKVEEFESIFEYIKSDNPTKKFMDSVQLMQQYQLDPDFLPEKVLECYNKSRNNLTLNQQYRISTLKALIPEFSSVALFESRRLNNGLSNLSKLLVPPSLTELFNQVPQKIKNANNIEVEMAQIVKDMLACMSTDAKIFSPDNPGNCSYMVTAQIEELLNLCRSKTDPTDRVLCLTIVNIIKTEASKLFAGDQHPHIHDLEFEEKPNSFVKDEEGVLSRLLINNLMEDTADNKAPLLTILGLLKKMPESVVRGVFSEPEAGGDNKIVNEMTKELCAAAAERNTEQLDQIISLLPPKRADQNEKLITYLDYGARLTDALNDNKDLPLFYDDVRIRWDLRCKIEKNITQNSYEKKSDKTRLLSILDSDVPLHAALLSMSKIALRNTESFRSYVDIYSVRSWEEQKLYKDLKCFSGVSADTVSEKYTEFLKARGDFGAQNVSNIEHDYQRKALIVQEMQYPKKDRTLKALANLIKNRLVLSIKSGEPIIVDKLLWGRESPLKDIPTREQGVVDYVVTLFSEEAFEDLLSHFSQPQEKEKLLKVVTEIVLHRTHASQSQKKRILEKVQSSIAQDHESLNKSVNEPVLDELLIDFDQVKGFARDRRHTDLLQLTEEFSAIQMPETSEVEIKEKDAVHFSDTGIKCSLLSIINQLSDKVSGKQPMLNILNSNLPLKETLHLIRNIAQGKLEDSAFKNAYNLGRKPYTRRLYKQLSKLTGDENNYDISEKITQFVRKNFSEKILQDFTLGEPENIFKEISETEQRLKEYRQAINAAAKATSLVPSQDAISVFKRWIDLSALTGKSISDDDIALMDMLAFDAKSIAECFLLVETKLKGKVKDQFSNILIEKLKHIYLNPEAMTDFFAALVKDMNNVRLLSEDGLEAILKHFFDVSEKSPTTLFPAFLENIASVLAAFKADPSSQKSSELIKEKLVAYFEESLKKYLSNIKDDSKEDDKDRSKEDDKDRSKEDALSALLNMIAVSPLLKKIAVSSLQVDPEKNQSMARFRRLLIGENSALSSAFSKLLTNQVFDEDVTLKIVFSAAKLVNQQSHVKDVFIKAQQSENFVESFKALIEFSVLSNQPMPKDFKGISFAPSSLEEVIECKKYIEEKFEPVNKRSFLRWLYGYWLNSQSSDKDLYGQIKSAIELVNKLNTTEFFSLKWMTAGFPKLSSGDITPSGVLVYFRNILDNSSIKENFRQLTQDQKEVFIKKLLKRLLNFFENSKEKEEKEGYKKLTKISPIVGEILKATVNNNESVFVAKLRRVFEWHKTVVDYADISGFLSFVLAGLQKSYTDAESAKGLLGRYFEEIINNKISFRTQGEVLHEALARLLAHDNDLVMRKNKKFAHVFTLVQNFVGRIETDSGEQANAEIGLNIAGLLLEPINVLGFLYDPRLPSEQGKAIFSCFVYLHPEKTVDLLKELRNKCEEGLLGIDFLTLKNEIIHSFCTENSPAWQIQLYQDLKSSGIEWSDELGLKSQQAINTPRRDIIIQPEVSALAVQPSYFSALAEVLSNYREAVNRTSLFFESRATPPACVEQITAICRQNGISDMEKMARIRDIVGDKLQTSSQPVYQELWKYFTDNAGDHYKSSQRDQFALKKLTENLKTFISSPSEEVTNTISPTIP
jgi:hypothetical protein